MSQSDAHPSPPTQEYVSARNQMVDSQIRPLQVNDARILKAMREVPRERFVPPAAAGFAYADRAVPLGGGRVLMEPRIIGRMLQVASPRAGERALVVAAGTGYAAVLLARLGLTVIALEQDAALAGRGAAICAALAPTIRFETGPLQAGWADASPYELILIDGAVRTLPPVLAGQLAAAGRLAAVLWPEAQVGTVVLAEASNGGLRGRPQFDASTPLIPELAPRPAFAF